MAAVWIFNCRACEREKGWVLSSISSVTIRLCRANTFFVRRVIYRGENALVVVNVGVVKA